MDKKERKQLAQEYTRLTKKISRVLKRFAPIDPTDEYSMGDDYDVAIENIVSLLLRDSDRDKLLRILAQTRQEAGVPPDPEKDAKIADAVLKSAKSHAPPPKPRLAFRLDLRNDLPPIESYMVNRVEGFDPVRNHGPGRSDSISQIMIGFESSQAGWLAIVFDTGSEPSGGGEWTRYLGVVPLLKREHWVKAGIANMRGPIAIVNAQGNERKYPEEQADMAVDIGNMIRELVLDLRNRGVFSHLPHTHDCELFVEDFDGGYFWPDCETEGAANRVSD